MAIVTRAIDRMLEQHEPHPALVLDRLPGIDRRACRQRVQQCFSIETMVEGYEQVYATIFDLIEKEKRQS